MQSVIITQFVPQASNSIHDTEAGSYSITKHGSLSLSLSLSLSGSAPSQSPLAPPPLFLPPSHIPRERERVRQTNLTLLLSLELRSSASATAFLLPAHSSAKMTSVLQGFSKSLAMTVLSEIGDKTFFAAAILAMRHPRRLVLSGCLAALIVMTILSAVVGWAAPNLISRKWTHHITTLLFFGFGMWSLWDAFHEGGESEELAEVEAKLDADWKKPDGATKKGEKVDDDMKKQNRPFLSQFFSPILLKAFSITFFGEWGDKSQLATIGLAADENPFGVVLGGILGQTLCTAAAVLGGKSLASQISEKIVALSGGILFIVFGIQSFLSSVKS
ncbi:GDT1-like protein 5 isoform X2 [Punica granatum]|uniref:GDT1 family protein n=2 Tax=Punica granatum TaxID=22663 RepID=A0A6P8D6A6_PUNGR|nr:GDT1-like protein 5 isoform X2 [Punica granatum]